MEKRIAKIISYVLIETIGDSSQFTFEELKAIIEKISCEIKEHFLIKDLEISTLLLWFLIIDLIQDLWQRRNNF